MLASYLRFHLEKNVLKGVSPKSIHPPTHRLNFKTWKSKGKVDGLVGELTLWRSLFGIWGNNFLTLEKLTLKKRQNTLSEMSFRARDASSMSSDIFPHLLSGFDFKRIWLRGSG